MADTRLLEPFGVSELDRENRLLWRVPRVCELCLSTVVTLSRATVGNHVLWRLRHSEKLHRAKKNDSASFFFSSCIFCLLKSTCCVLRESESLFVYFVLLFRLFFSLVRVDLNEECFSVFSVFPRNFFFFFFSFFQYFPEILVFLGFSRIPKFRENTEKKLKNTPR